MHPHMRQMSPEEIDNLMSHFPGMFGGECRHRHQGDGSNEPSVVQTEDGVVVKMDMPGVPKECVDITVSANRLSIEGRRTEGPRYFHTFMVHQDDFDMAKAEAKLDMGVLTLTLPRKQPPVTRIPVA